MLYVSKYLLVLILPLLVSGCFGLAHISVPVPPIKVIAELAPTNGQAEHRFTIAEANYYGNTRLFADLLRGSLHSDSHAYTFVNAQLSGAEAFTHTFPEDDRYIGYPVLIIPLPPSRRVAESRVLFVMPEGATVIYRVDITGSRARTRYADIAALQAPASPVFPESGKGLSEWRATVAEEDEFYRSVRWRRVTHIEVLELQRSSEEDYIALRVRTAD